MLGFVLYTSKRKFAWSNTVDCRDVLYLRGERRWILFTYFTVLYNLGRGTRILGMQNADVAEPNFALAPARDSGNILQYSSKKQTLNLHLSLALEASLSTVKVQN